MFGRSKLGSPRYLRKHGFDLSEPEEISRRLQSVSNANLRAAIVSHLPCLGEAAVSPLVGSLRDPDFMVVIKAAEALSRMGAKAAPATADLVGFVRSFGERYPNAKSLLGDSDVASNVLAPLNAIKALASIGTAEALTLLRETARSTPNEYLKEQAILGLASFGHQAVGALVEMLDHYPAAPTLISILKELREEDRSAFESSGTLVASAMATLSQEGRSTAAYIYQRFYKHNSAKDIALLLRALRNCVQEAANEGAISGDFSIMADLISRAGITSSKTEEELLLIARIDPTTEEYITGLAQKLTKARTRTRPE